METFGFDFKLDDTLSASSSGVFCFGESTFSQQKSMTIDDLKIPPQLLIQKSTETLVPGPVEIIGHESNAKVSWDKFNPVIKKGQKWSGSAKITLGDDETIVPNTLHMKPYWLMKSDRENLVPHGDSIVSSFLVPISLENYLHTTKNGIAKPVFRNDSIFTDFKDADGTVCLQMSCIFDLRNRSIHSKDQLQQCPEGALSLCLEVVTKDPESGCETLHRSWSNGFTVIGKNGRVFQKEILEAPPSDKVFVRCIKPGIMPVKQYKRISKSLGSPLSCSTDGFQGVPVSTSGRCRLYEYRFLGHHGVVHSFEPSSEVDLYFSSSSRECYPSDNITLTEATGMHSWRWKNNYIMTLTFRPTMARKLLNPSSFTFTISCGSEHFTKTIDIETI